MSGTHKTAGDHGGNQRTSSAYAEQPNWSRLPRDLLGEVYNRLAAPVGRARFAAACTSWRAAASRHPPRRALPFLMLDPGVGYKKRRFLYCPEDDVVLPRLSLRNDPARGCFVGSHDGGWVAWSEPPFGIMNLFSGAEIPLSTKQKRGARGVYDSPLLFRKIIFSETPTSQGCIIAGIIQRNYVAMCMIGCLEGGWAIHEESVMDIAFSNGELYGIMDSYNKTLNKFEIGMDKDGIPYFKTVYMLATMPNPLEIVPELHGIYLVELCGKIVMAVRRTQGRRPCPRDIHGPIFMLFKLADANVDGVTLRRSFNWEEVTRLNDHALFLGPTCSKAVHVLEDRHGYAHRNHVYYSDHRCFTHNAEISCGAKELLRSSNNNGHRGCQVYYKEDENINNGIDEIMSIGYYVRGNLHPPMWIFPPNL